MAYFHQWKRTQIRTPFPMLRLYYAELFPLVQIRIWIPVWRVSQMVTVPILGTDLHPKDRSLSLFYTFESGDQSLNPNQWKSCIVQESVSESESDGGNRPLLVLSLLLSCEGLGIMHFWIRDIELKPLCVAGSWCWGKDFLVNI